MLFLCSCCVIIRSFGVINNAWSFSVYASSVYNKIQNFQGKALALPSIRRGNPSQTSPPPRSRRSSDRAHFKTWICLGLHITVWKARANPKFWSYGPFSPVRNGPRISNWTSALWAVIPASVSSLQSPPKERKAPSPLTNSTV